MHHQNSFKHLSHLLQHVLVRLYKRIDRFKHCITHRNNRTARTFHINNTFSTVSKLLTPNVQNTAGLIKHLLPYSIHSQWMAFALSLFADRKRLTEHCSLRDAFNSNVAIFNVHKWRDTTTLHPFNSLFSRTTWVRRHQKGKPFWILLEQEMMGWRWHQLDYM